MDLLQEAKRKASQTSFIQSLIKETNEYEINKKHTGTGIFRCQQQE